MAKNPELTITVGKPLTGAQTVIGVMLAITIVSFAAAWFMIAGLMERTAELELILEKIEGQETKIATLEAQVEVLRRPKPGPMETGGALALSVVQMKP